MPKISQKGNLMPESPIRKLVPYAEKAKNNGIEVIHLNIGQPDIKTPKVAIQAVKKFDNKIISYSHSAGNLSFRKKLSSYYQKNNIKVSYDDILVTTGGSEALTFTLNCIADNGDEIIIPEPFYANYNGFSISSGLKIIPISSDIKNGFALPKISEFEKKITSNTKAILICNPGNPTGYLYSYEELNELKKIVLKYDLFLISDEVYREFTYDSQKHHSILQLDDLSENSIMIDSVSKRYSMCGARIGSIVSKNKKIISTALKFSQSRLSPPSFGQIAAEAALDVADNYLTEVVKEYENRRNLLISELNKIDNIICPKPLGAFYCIAELPVNDSEDFAKWLLESFQINNKTLMIAPAEGFYSTKGFGKNQIRIAYVLNENQLKDAILILKNGLNEYKKITKNE